MEKLVKKSRNLKAQFCLRIDPDVLAWLKDEAEKHDRPINYVINHAIKQFRKQQEI